MQTQSRPERPGAPVVLSGKSPEMGIRALDSVLHHVVQCGAGPVPSLCLFAYMYKDRAGVHDY